MNQEVSKHTMQKTILISHTILTMSKLFTPIVVLLAGKQLSPDTGRIAE